MELCSIASGSSGNCIFAGTDSTQILIDAGISGKKIEEGLNEIGLKTSEMQAILVTHEHIDHIKSLGVVARKHGIPMYATKGTINYMLNNNCIGKVDESLFNVIRADEEFMVGDINIKPVATSHDAAESVAFIMSQGRKSMGVITDLGCYDDNIVEMLKGLDVILLEANHDERMLQAGWYPYQLKQRILSNRGHLCNEAAGRLLSRVLHDDFKTVVLGHLSKDNNYPMLAYEAVRAEIAAGDNPYTANDFPVVVARRDAVTPKIVF